MKKTLYLECFSGISGDMTVGALIDLGADREALKKALESLPLAGFSITISEVEKSGIRACDFSVNLEEENPDHDMEYLYGREPEAKETYSYGHEHHGHHHHRTMKDIREVIGQSRLTENAKKIALRIFEILSGAEGKVHGVPSEEVHFHEVGAVDSIIDIAAAAVCLDLLSPDEVAVPVLFEGYGTVRTQHGVLPVPVPAVAALVEVYEIPLQPLNIPGEFVTPTGAAIAAAVRTKKKLPDRYRIKKTGIGAGKRIYDGPGILRAMWIEEET